MKKPTIKSIEKHINETFLFAQYETLLEQIKSVEFLNMWLVTEDGKAQFGSDVAEQKLKLQEADLKIKYKQLEFIKSLIK